jgi:hypothetical protein
VVSATGKKFVTLIERIDMKNNDKPRSGYTCKFCGKSTEKKDDFCSKDCEITFLKGELSKRGRDSEPCCYGRIEWGTCVQALYSTSSFDAKKRTSDLRKLGFVCEATRIKGVPIFSDDNKIVNEQMTILTCRNKGKNGNEKAPLPTYWDVGLKEGKVIPFPSEAK